MKFARLFLTKVKLEIITSSFILVFFGENRNFFWEMFSQDVFKRLPQKASDNMKKHSRIFSVFVTPSSAIAFIMLWPKHTTTI